MRTLPRLADAFGPGHAVPASGQELVDRLASCVQQRAREIVMGLAAALLVFTGIWHLTEFLM